jgi:hypothetical protein
MAESNRHFSPRADLARKIPEKDSPPLRSPSCRSSRLLSSPQALQGHGFRSCQASRASLMIIYANVEHGSRRG